MMRSGGRRPTLTGSIVIAEWARKTLAIPIVLKAIKPRMPAITDSSE